MRQRLNDGRELLRAAARRNPVRDVALAGALRPNLREVEDTDALGDTMQSSSNLIGMVSTSFVVVADDDHIGTAQALAVFCAPLSRSTWIARRDQLNGTESVNVLLPLNHVNNLFPFDRSPEVAQAVEHAARVIE